MKIRRSSILKYAFIPVTSCFILAIFLLTFSVNVKSASAQSYFPFVQNNDNIPANVYGAVTSSYPLDDYYVFISSIGYSSWGNTNYPYFAISKQYAYPYATISQDGYHFSFYNGSSGSYGECRVQGNGNLSINSGLNISYNPYFQNLVSPLYDTSISYFMNFDLYTDSSEVVPVAFVTAPLTVPTTGHATSPTGVPSLSYPIGMHPTQAPTVPTYTVPTPSNAPTFDINQPFQSLFDILDYWFNFVVDLISGLIQVIIDWWQFIGELILWIFNYYIDWLNTFTDWLYNIFKYLFEPIYNFLSNFFSFLFNEEDQISIFDLITNFKDDLIDTLGSLFSNSFFSNYWSNFESKLEDAFNYFSKIVLFFTTLIVLGTDPTTHEFSIPYLTQILLCPDVSSVELLLLSHDDFKLITIGQNLVTMSLTIYNTLINITPSGVIHVPSCYYHGQQIGDFDIDFSWFNQYKAYSDLLISGFLVFGYFYWLYITFASHLKGVFMPDVTPEDDSYKRHNIGF